MLRKLFKRKPRLEATQPEDRVAALNELDPTDQAAIARVFRDDPDRQVRGAALALLTDGDALAAGLDDADFAAAVADRVVAVLGEDDTHPVRSHPTVLRAALARAETPETAIAAAGRIEDLPTRAEALAANPTALLRLAVADATWAPDALVEFEKAARGRDKSVHRLARDRLAQLKAAAAERDRQDAEIEKLLTAATLCSRRRPLQGPPGRHRTRLGPTARRPPGNRRRFGQVRCRRPRRRGGARPVSGAARCEAVGGTGHRGRVRAAGGRSARARRIGRRRAARRRDRIGARRAQDSADALAAKWNATADARPPSEETAGRFRNAMATHAARRAVAERALGLVAQAEKLLAREVPDPDATDAKPVYAVRSSIDSQRDAIAALLGRFAENGEPESATGVGEALPQPAAVAELEARQRALEAVATPLRRRRRGPLRRGQECHRDIARVRRTRRGPRSRGAGPGAARAGAAPAANRRPGVQSRTPGHRRARPRAARLARLCRSPAPRGAVRGDGTARRDAFGRPCASRSSQSAASAVERTRHWRLPARPRPQEAVRPERGTRLRAVPGLLQGAGGPTFIQSGAAQGHRRRPRGLRGQQRLGSGRLAAASNTSCAKRARSGATTTRWTARSPATSRNASRPWPTSSTSG